MTSVDLADLEVKEEEKETTASLIRGVLAKLHKADVYKRQGFGSWLECLRMVGSGSAAYGQGWDMDAIAACVVGGVSFTGGIGKISGVVTGVLIFTSLTYSLTILGIDTNLQFIFEGIIILAAVTLDCLKYVQKK